MESLFSDIRYAVRNLLKRPGFTAIAVITLALGIGANSAIFSTVHALLLKPLPFPELDRVMAVWEKFPSRGVDRNEVTVADYLDWRAQNQTFEHLGIYRGWSANLTGMQPPERLVGFQVSPNFFDVIGVKPMLGRPFAADEDQLNKTPVVILSYGLWQRRFGGDPTIINKQISLNGVTRTVIGVLPSELNYPPGADVIAPLTLTREQAGNRDNHAYLVVGRLKNGIAPAAAQTDLDTIAKRLEQQYPKTNTGWGAAVFPIVEDTVRFYKTAVLVLMAAVGFVLLIVCANVANLMLARAAGRQKEMALRAALGAGRWRLMQQLLTESVLLALIGGALGPLIGFWGVDLLKALNPGEAAKFAPGWERLGFSLPVFIFNLAVSIFSGLLFGLAPAWQVARTDLNEALKEGGRQTASGRNRLRGLLVISEVALSLMLLISAGLLMRTFVRLIKTDPGFNPANVMTMSLSVPAAKYREESQRAAFYQELIRRIEALPGIQSAGAVNYLPLGGGNASNSFFIEGRPEPPPGQEWIGRYRVCTPDYFVALGIPLLRGRSFTDQDKPGSTPVVIVNETFAKTYWPNEDAIGKRMRIAGPLKDFPWLQVVGVVRDVKHELNTPNSADFFLPHAQDVWSSMVVVARTKGDPLSYAGAIRQQVWDIDRDQPVYKMRTMEDVRAFSVSLYSFSSASLGLFAGIALLLAAIGIYGVMSYAVSLRTQEIGIRMALGAGAIDVLKLVVRSGMALAAIGVIVGLGGAFAITRFMSSLLFGVSPTDIGTFALVTVGLLFVALFACYIPARRATKVDPLVALRYE